MNLNYLKKVNNILNKYKAILLSGILLFIKKENSKVAMTYGLLTLIGYILMNDKENEEHSKENSEVNNNSWKEFIQKKINKTNISLGKNKDTSSETSEEYTNNNIVNNHKNHNEKNENNVYNEVENNDNLENDENLENNNNTENIEIKTEKKGNILDNIKTKISNLHKKIKEKHVNKIVDKFNKKNAYPDKINTMNKEYNDIDDNIFQLKVNENNKNIPIFNLRSSDNIDFFWNFHLHNADNSKINNLILCRDIHQWMSNTSISNEDLDNKCYPIYIILKDHKTNNEIMIFEAYKIFVYPNENGNKHAFISKGNNYKAIEEVLNILIDLNYIKNILNNKEYESYNLTSHDSVCLFLNNLLSHFLPSETQNGEVINIDVNQFNENKNTFDYFYHTNNMETEMFNTNI